jgi:type I restriction-modification system DNA methylase subunit/restriction endonuclease S subunit
VEELKTQYGTTQVNDIVSVMETQLYIQTTLTNNENIKSKKLIQTSVNIELNNTLISNITTETDDTITEYEINMTEQSNNISSREALKDKVHEIHNFLRNNGAGYGMMALKLFLLFFGLKKIEEKGLFEKTGLTLECRFSHLLEHARTGNGELLLETICKTVLDAIYDSILKPFLFYEIPKDLSAKVFIYLLEQIEEITVIERTCDVLLSGNIYEYFIGRDESAISELGAYFTVRWITRYCMGKSNLQLNDDGSIPTMIDMFGGSGGFTTEYIRHFVQNYPEIDWETQLSRVSHYDMNEDVVKSAALEFFCLTGVIPKMGADGQLCRKNSFCDEFDNQEYQRLLTNPPYGGDKNKKTEAQDKNQKIKEYITRELPTITDTATRISRQKQLEDIIKQEKEQKKKSEDAKVSVATSSSRIQRYAKKYDLKGTDKEAVSLIQFMDMVADGGRVVGVLKEGVFFDKSYKKLRTHLVTHFNVREIISVPQDQFENTSTKTSILVFDNVEEKTTKVMFRELVVDKYVEDKFAEVRGKIVLAESAGDICGVTDSIVSEATIAELLANPICSFNGKDYGKKELVVGEDYAAVKLGSVAKLENGKQLDKKNIINGIYPVYGGGLQPVGYHNNYNSENATIIAGTGHCGFVQFNKNKFWASQCFTIKTENELINRYLFIICKCLEPTFMNSGSGSVQKFIRASQFKDMLIPVPKSPEKTQQWVDYISAPYNEKNVKRGRVAELETFVQTRIREITTTEECEEVKLGDLCEIKSGNHTTKKSDFKEGPYLVIGGGIHPICRHNEFNCDENTILCASHGTVGLINMYPVKTFLTVCFGLVIQNTDVKMFVYNYLKNINREIINLGNGTTLKCISKTQLSAIKIKLPKNRQLIADLEPIFEEIERLQHEIKLADELYQSRIQELAKEALPEQPLIANEAPALENTFIETDAPEIPDDTVSVAESVATTSTTTSGKKPRKPHAKKEPKEKVVKEPKPKKETKPRKPRSKKEGSTDKEPEPK